MKSRHSIWSLCSQWYRFDIRLDDWIERANRSAFYATNTTIVPSTSTTAPSWFPLHGSSPLTSPQSHRLPVFLQFRNQPVTLLDHVGVLLVLVIGPVRFYDLVDAVDGAGYAVCGDEFGQITANREKSVSYMLLTSRAKDKGDVRDGWGKR